MKRTAQDVEEAKSVKPPKRNMHPNSLRNLVAPWSKGASANPGGLPGTDIAARIARDVFSQNEEEIYARMTAAVFGGNAYAFQVLADRGFGKLKETKEIGGTIRYEQLDLSKLTDRELAELGTLVESATTKP